MAQINERLAELRKERGLSLTQVVVKTAISGSYIYLLETKDIVPSPDKLRKLAKAYEVPYVELMEIAGYLDRADLREYHEMAGSQSFNLPMKRQRATLRAVAVGG
jgi:transcriptional regulator with XRE-family HTH domain